MRTDRPTCEVKSDTGRRAFGAAALMVALAAGTATMAILAHGRPAMAQVNGAGIKQKEVREQVDRAGETLARCDVTALERVLKQLEETRANLQIAAKAGVQGAGDDADRVRQAIETIQSRMKSCPDPKTATSVAGPGGKTYFFADPAVGGWAELGIADALKAARACDVEAFKRALKAISDYAVSKYLPKSADQHAYIQMARDLSAAQADLFKHCTEPGKAEAPKQPATTEPAKTDPPKTGAGTGEPVKPPEPPKAPPMTPSVGQAPGMPAPMIFRPGDVLINALLVPTVEFSIALGIRNNSADGHYTGTAQAPGSGSGSESKVNLGAGATIWLPLYNFQTGSVINPFEVQLTRNAFRPQYAQLDPDLGWELSNLWFAMGVLSIGGRSDFVYLGDGKKAVLELVRHGPNGAVELTESERTMVSLLLLVRFSFAINLARMGLFGSQEFADRHDAQYADTDYAQAPRPRGRANWWPVHIYAGGGPSFVRTKITMTSNQAPGGGVFQSLSETKTDTAWSFVLGAQTAACRTCIFGKPLMLGVEGQWTWMPSRTVSITSSTFGFTETGRVDNRSSARVMFTASVPFTFR